MRAIQKPFFTLTAADLMCRTVLLIPLDTPLRDAAKMLAEIGVHVLPLSMTMGGAWASFRPQTWPAGAEPGRHTIAFAAHLPESGDHP